MSTHHDFDDEAAEENDHYAQYPKLRDAWIYIAIDIRCMDMVKVGLTTRESPIHRVSQGKTYNPFLTLFASYELSKCTFGASQKELDDIENYIHGRYIFGPPVKHLHTGKNSEWFFIHPEEAEHQIDWILAKRGFAVDNKTLYTNDIKFKKYNGIAVDRMKKIKTIYRPHPHDFESMAEQAGIPFNLYSSYYAYLDDFYKRDDDGKIYL